MATNEWTGFRLVPLLILTLSVFGLGRGLSVVPPGEIVYQMSAWNDAIGMVTKSLNHSQSVLSVVGIEVFSDPPVPIGGTWVGPLRRLPYTILFVLMTPLFPPDYTEAFRIAYRIGYTFTALVAYPLSGFAVYKLGQALGDHRAGVLALTLFVCQEIVGWPINPLYRLKFQHTMSIPICLFALWAAVKAIQSDERASSDRYAVVAGALLGVGGLTQYHHTLVSIVGVVGALLITRRLRSASHVVGSGLLFAVFYVVVPAAGQKVVTKAIGVFAGDSDGGGPFVTVGGVIDTATTPGVAILLVGLVCSGLLLFVTKEGLADGYPFEITLAGS